MEIFLIVLLLVIIICIIQKSRYRKTEYYRQTRNSYKSIQLDKGLLGEFSTYKCLDPLAGYKRYLFNLYIPKSNGETTELDIVLLHESGIYVFESKNYSGWIVGSETEQYWTQLLGREHSQKNQFYNPILQNEGHLRWLRIFLADRTLPFYSYIVFSDHCTLKDISLTSRKHYVVRQQNLLSAVERNAAKAKVRLTPDKIDKLFEKLYPLTQMDEAKKLAHIKNIKQRTKNNSPTISTARAIPKVNKSMCPRCGGKLVMRTAAKGNHKGKKFWGCSNYPECRYIENLSDQ